MEVNVLGTKYEITTNATVKDYPGLKGNDGYTDFSVKKIVIAQMEKDEYSQDDLESYSKQVLRHELVHAFMFESGLDSSSSYARNEELIDWIAIQSPKMLEAFNSVSAIKK